MEEVRNDYLQNVHGKKKTPDQVSQASTTPSFGTVLDKIHTH